MNIESATENHVRYTIIDFRRDLSRGFAKCPWYFHLNRNLFRRHRRSWFSEPYPKRPIVAWDRFRSETDRIAYSPIDELDRIIRALQASERSESHEHFSEFRIAEIALRAEIAPLTRHQVQDWIENWSKTADAYAAARRSQLPISILFGSIVAASLIIGLVYLFATMVDLATN